MDSEVWWPHSIVDHSLSEVPLLEEVTLVFLMSWMELWKVDHLAHQFELIETLVYKNIILLMHSTVATLARSLENFKSSSECC